MLLHLWEFIGSVSRHWVTLLSGLIVIVISLIERKRGKQFTGWPVWSAVLVLFFFACFQAWQDERVKAEGSTGLNLLSITPQEVVGVFTGRTTEQGQSLAKVYIGKWLQVSGAIQDIQLDKDLFGRTSHTIWLAGYEPAIFTKFGKKWDNQISALSAGDNITVVGQIENIAHNDIWLSNCQLKDIPHGQRK